MQNPKRIALVGAGGVGCQLGPVLSLTHNLHIIDGDVYEPENATRQFAALRATANKAETLAQCITDNQPSSNILSFPRYVESPADCYHPMFTNVDMIISGVDNVKSRLLLCNIADTLGIPCLLAGNEEFMAEAHLFLAEVHNPFAYFHFNVDAPAPFDCNSDTTLEKHPQTVSANGMAAGCIHQLLTNWCVTDDTQNLMCYTKQEVFYSESKRVRDFAIDEVIPKADMHELVTDLIYN